MSKLSLAQVADIADQIYSQTQFPEKDMDGTSFCCSPSEVTAIIKLAKENGFTPEQVEEEMVRQAIEQSEIYANHPDF
jgi:predicted metal-binding transcription factor (methanogenesis marker protein 9)